MRLLLVGGGHAMLPLLTHAGEHVRQGVEVTLLSDRADLWYSGMTPEWLGGVYSRADVTVDLGRICVKQDVRFIEDAAVALDRDAREVETAGGRRLGYDLVALDVGAVNPLAARAGDAVRTKPLHCVEALGAFLDEPGAGPRQLVIVGGGAAGVEIALNVTARPDVRALRVVLVEPGDRLLDALPPRAGAWALRTLRERGAEVRLGTAVEGVEEGRVRLAGGQHLPADAVLWATGSVGPAFLGDSGLETTARGFVRVDAGLRALSDARVFVAGDAAAVFGHERLARIGVHAVKQGPVLRENVDRVLRALRDRQPAATVPLRPFRPYPAAPLIVSTGVRTAWLAVGPVAVGGEAFLRLKHAVDRRWIDRYRPPDTYRRRADARAACDGPVASDARPEGPGRR